VAEWLEITEENRDDWSRKGIYLFLGTKLSQEQGQVHCEDGPAVIGPDGVERWYVRGQEITSEVKTLFRENHWNPSQGLESPEQQAMFKAMFVGL
jgi:SLT domain-containing protein